MGIYCDYFFIGVFCILSTPGPTNTLLAASGLDHGVKRSVKLIPAEAIGYIISISFWGFFLLFISKESKELIFLIKIISALYIIFISIKIWIYSSSLDKVNNITPLNLVVSTILNPKGLIFASEVFPRQAWEGMLNYIFYITCFLLILMPIAFLWIIFGSKINNVKKGIAKKVISLILLLFSIYILNSIFV